MYIYILFQIDNFTMTNVSNDILKRMHDFGKIKFFKLICNNNNSVIINDYSLAVMYWFSNSCKNFPTKFLKL